MSKELSKEEVTAILRRPFKKEQIGKLPKAGIQLDYVGHANVTDRLLEADPEWTWEPMAVDEFGLPKTDSKGNLWIKLTIDGITRIGVGDGPTAKVCIGDAIRNGAMRFGVALDLWSKEELESGPKEPTSVPSPKSPPPANPGQQVMQDRDKLREAFEAKGYTDPVEKLAFVKLILDKNMPATHEDYLKVIEALEAI